MAARGKRASKGEWGMHLMIDGYTEEMAQLGDVSSIMSLLTGAVAAIGLNIVMDPIVYQYPPSLSSTEVGGVSGVVLIAQSHVAIHTYPETGLVNVDIFSCGDFAVTSAVQYFVVKLSLHEYNTRLINRSAIRRTDPRSGNL